MAHVTLNIVARGGKLHGITPTTTVTLPADTPLTALYARLALLTRLSVHRLRLTYKSPENPAVNVHLDPNLRTATVGSAGLMEKSTVYVKDLGPQLAWRTVYIIEYLGPLLIHPLFLFYLRPYLYKEVTSETPPPSRLQCLLCYIIVLHFIKRELETIFIHQFSLATMPARNIFRNSAHYWLLSGINIAYWVYSPSAESSATATGVNPYLLYSGLILFIAGELANFNCHLTLRNLRKPGSTAREIPRGFAFDIVTCPNYFFEVVAWIGIWLVSGCSWSILLFTVVGGTTMYVWAKEKERRYRKLFGDRYKKKRCVMFPGLM
ncbi:3-oxo-5a-steroid 4- dehydrogenase [Ascosphaera aggregata]|nr:3-oxo-5a-steroid 4- dehydrogenase [Ascosphaera aggregata]